MVDRDAPSSAGIPAPAGGFARWRAGIAELLAVPSYRLLWLSGFLWNLTRWMGIFLGSYLVNQLTGSPFLVQLVGAAFFAPMLFGGVMAGVVSDRFDRRRTMLNQVGALALVSLGMAALVASELVRTWMVYPFMLAVGVGGVVDITSRRALVQDLVGDTRISRALALESLGSSIGNTLGAVIGGTVIAVVGIGEAFGVIALCYAGAFACLLAVRAPARPAPLAPTSIRDDLAAGFNYARRDRALISILGVTVLMNLCFFAFLPIVPVVADNLGVGAALAGLLGSGMGLGMMIGSLSLAGADVRGRGRIYVGGSVLALCFLAGFALIPVYWLALGSLIVAGIGVAGFATMQSALVMAAAGPEMRGRAMGMLGMAIGALPIGTIFIGLLAEQFGAGLGVGGAVAAGLLLLALWLAVRPESWRIA